MASGCGVGLDNPSVESAPVIPVCGSLRNFWAFSLFSEGAESATLRPWSGEPMSLLGRIWR